MIKLLSMIQEAICINKIILMEDLFLLDRIVIAKVIAMLTPYNLFLGSTFLYFFVYCYCTMMNGKKKKGVK